jgi:glyoxylase-like metal-dependent hydrolase (beta-lactamase superfamily II)
VDFSTLKEGDEIGIGDYLFTCIETHGHSPGHMCLYEPSKKILVSGDHLLIDITPNIALWSDREDPLSEYLASLDKVYALDVNLVLPGHRGIFNDHRKRILELKHHHQARANEIISILEKGKKNAYEVASQMTWDVTYDSWQVFPSSQKWFAVGETLAHLKYLEERRIVRKEMQGQEIVFLAM